MPAERSRSCSDSNKRATRRLAPSIDRRIAAIANRQHQLITLDQLTAIGLVRSQVHRRVWSGRLHWRYSGVYSLTAEPASLEARLCAPVLSCGPAAWLSHRSALVLWRICDPRPGPTHVTTPTGAGRKDPRIRAHRTRQLPAEHITRRHNIPTTTPGRALIDFAATATHRELERALSEARYLRLIDPPTLAAQIHRQGPRRGIGPLRELLASPPTRTRSELEERMLALIREAGLPEPLVNQRIATAEGPLEVDFHWPEHRLVVETDGRGAHDHAAAFESDRRRDQLLAAAGWRTLRFTAAHVCEEAARTVATVAGLLREA